MIEDAANATFFLPLDKLVADTDNMQEAMRRAVDTVSSGVTLFWRLVEKPGYIRLDTERLRHILSGAGRGRFATVTAKGPDRAAEVVDRLIRSDMLATSSGPVRSILCGILAGDDLLLSEVGKIADGVRGAFAGLTFDLATVNDESTFSGRVSVVVMLFESGGKAADEARPGGVMSGRRRKSKSILSVGPTGRGRFNGAEPTIWNGEDLDIPTFIRKNLNLDF
jgi:cell division GTPase FtsZ